MKETKPQGNNPELIVDWNGHAVQAWTLGGRTITVASGADFKCESTLLRLCNTGGSTVRIKLKGAAYDELIKDATDEGTPILPNTCVMVGVYSLGQIYSVEGGSLDVTFVMDRNVRQITGFPAPPAFTDSDFDQDPIKVAGLEAIVEKLSADHILKYSGVIAYNGIMDGHYVGIQITPTVSLEDFSNVAIRVVDQFGSWNYGKDIFTEDGSLIWHFKVEQTPSIKFMIEINWNSENFEYFYIEIDPTTILE